MTRDEYDKAIERICDSIIGVWVSDEDACEIVDQIRTYLPPPPPDGWDEFKKSNCPPPPDRNDCVEVRVACVVDESGDWFANGWRNGEDRMMLGDCRRAIGDKEYQASYITAYVPKPTATVEVEGVVSE